jgi:hypothetical protein
MANPKGDIRHAHDLYGGPEHQRRLELGRHMTKMRSILRNAGFQVDADGPATARLNKAWHAYRVGGAAAAKYWNKQNPRTEAPVVSSARGTHAQNPGGPTDFHAPKQDHVQKQIDKANQKATNTNKVQTKAAVHSAALAGKQKGVGGGKAPSIKVGGSDLPGLKIGNPNVNKLIPTATADKIAGLQFDPQIREALLQQERGKRDTAQAQADISNWFGQAEGSQATAAQRDTAAADSARGSVANELQGIISSLGGSRGAGVVGASGLADLTALASQGAGQEQYNADLAPIIKGQEAGQHARQQALASQAAEKLGSQLIDLRGQRGQAQAAALADILSKNNAARQGNFANRLSAASTALAGQSLLGNQANIASEIWARTQGVKQNARALTLKAKSVKTATGRPSWLEMTPGDQQKAIDVALQPWLDPTTGGLRRGADPNAVANSIRTNLRGHSFSSARKPGFKGPGVDPRAQASIQNLIWSRLKPLIGRSAALGTTPPVPGTTP